MKFEPDQRQDFWDQFLERWSLARVQRLTLDEYTRPELRDPECFSAWVKYFCPSIGETANPGRSYESIGIYALPAEEGQPGEGAHTNRYHWRKQLGATTAEQAFQTVRATLIEIANEAALGRFETLEACVKRDLLEIRYAYKVAFLYQDQQRPLLLPFRLADEASGIVRSILDEWSPPRRQSKVREAIEASRQLLPLRRSQPLFEFMDQLERLVEEKQIARDTAADEAFGRQRQPTTLPETSNLATPPLNQILFGPPGTGKTHGSIDAALEILDPAFLAIQSKVLNPANKRKALKARFDELVRESRVRFVTFHQSFSYEDFVEGLRADINEEGQLQYKIEDGVFKRLCSDARTPTIASPTLVRPEARIWKISIAGTGPSPTKSYCLDHGEARIGWGETGDLRQDPESSQYYRKLGSGDQGTLRYFANEMSIGDVLLCIHSGYEIAAVGVVTGDYRYEREQDVPAGVIRDYQHVRPVEWLYRDLQVPISAINDNRPFTAKTVYRMNRVAWPQLAEHLANHGVGAAKVAQRPQRKSPPYVLIIDEVNRGNISRIFGELITLIEPSKRAGAQEALEVALPYSKTPPFSVPENVYLIGTMNTADRSLTSMDVALRRRFTFREMPPLPEELNGINVNGLRVGDLLRVMNQRIEALLDRDHCLGHAYFIGLREAPTINALADIFRRQVVPLLQEYFFDDWQRIQWVLNDHRKPEPFQFIRARRLNAEQLFGSGVDVSRTPQSWLVNDGAFAHIESYLAILDVPEAPDAA